MEYFNENNDENNPFLSLMEEFSEKIDEAAEQAYGDIIDTPIGTYTLATGPNPIIGGYISIISVSKEDKFIIPPIGIETSETEEESKDTHSKWLNIIINNPPMVFKDAITKELFFFPNTEISF